MSAARGLLGRLSSPDPRRRPPLLQAVVANVASILNTHEGDGYTCPTMGCNFVDLMSRWPSSESDVLSAVRKTVEMYEPRLCNVQVRRVPTETLVVLEITAELKESLGAQERVSMQTKLSLEGRMQVD